MCVVHSHTELESTIASMRTCEAQSRHVHELRHDRRLVDLRLESVCCCCLCAYEYMDSADANLAWHEKQQQWT